MGLTTGLAAGLLALGLAGCKSKDAAAPIVGPDGQDPAAANMAQPYTGGAAGGYSAVSTASGTAGVTPARPTRVLGASQGYTGQANGEDYGDPYGQEPGGQGPAPIIRQAPDGANAYGGQGGAYPGSYPGSYSGGSDGGYTDAEEAGAEAIAETNQAPPPLPEYDQPAAPDPNYLWTPGYWNYASAGYYWVPGVWVAPPFYGALWTPPFWGFYGGRYLFHRGYWGPHIGFYGGINYGFGYIGTGYYGGYWRGHDFFYNRAVSNVNVANIHNVYSRTVVYDNHTYGPRPENRVSFNGGQGGLNARPSSSETAAMHEAHYAPVAAQRDNRVAAASSRGQFFRADAGHPAVAFAAHAAGSTGNIAAAPREQPFNHPTAPGVAGRLGEVAGTGVGGARPQGMAGQPPVEAGRAVTPGQVRAGAGTESQPGRPATGQVRQEAAPGQPSTAQLNRMGNGATTNRAAANGARPVDRPPTAAAHANPGPAPSPQPAVAPAAQPASRPAAAASRPAAPAPRQPASAPHAQPSVQRQAAPVPQRSPAPMQRASPPAARPESAPRAAPAPAAPRAAPAAAAPRAAAPREGGGEHGGHR